MNICKTRHERSCAIKSQTKRLSVVLLAVSIFLCAMPVRFRRTPDTSCCNRA